MGKAIEWARRSSGQGHRVGKAIERARRAAQGDPWLSQFDCYGITDVGRVRPSNQDQFLIADLFKTMEIGATSLQIDPGAQLSGHCMGKLLLVADGVGGHLAGERASALVVETLSKYLLNMMHWLFRLEEDREQDFETDLKSALQTCHKTIREEAASHPDEQGMGTTLTMAYLIWPRMYIVHVGDSRCYVLRDTKLEQLTTDHTVAEQFVETGLLQPGEAESSRWSHVLWNVVGGNEATMDPVVYRCDLAPGDTLLLCTDGLTRHVSQEALTRTLRESGPARAACQNLVSAANAEGGQDNITVIVARCQG